MVAGQPFLFRRGPGGRRHHSGAHTHV